MDWETKRMLGYKDDEQVAGEGLDLPKPTFDMVSLVIASNQFLINYHKEHGMLPSQNPDIKIIE